MLGFWWGRLLWGLFNHTVPSLAVLTPPRTEEEEHQNWEDKQLPGMASSMIVSSAATVARTTAAAQPSKVAPFSGLKSTATFPVTRKSADLSSLPSNGGRVQCFNVWPPEGLKKFETLSYLPPLSDEQLAKEVDYLLRQGWVPCLEFSKEGFVHREYHASPGYYDGRYWTMWKLPMFGCTDSSQVIAELQEAKKAYPNYYVRIIGFDNKRQVQCISFIAYKPPNAEGN